MPKYGQYNSANLAEVFVTPTNTTRVITTNIGSNAYVNRVLEVLRAEGYPILLSAPII